MSNKILIPLLMSQPNIVAVEKDAHVAVLLRYSR